MHARGVRRSRGVEEEESYFISMADMMVGLLFVFIILLLYFALQYQQKSKSLSDAGEVRAQILRELKADIERSDLREKIDVKIDEKSGILSIPAEILFTSGDYIPSDQGKDNLRVVARAMERRLPCYTKPRRTTGCKPTTHTIDAVFIEGHTDSDPLKGWGPLKDNMDLSALRATNTYREMTAAAEGLKTLLNTRGYQVLSVSGYGATRTLPDAMGNSEEDKRKNRRIDLRFLMENPQDPELSSMLMVDE